MKRVFLLFGLAAGTTAFAQQDIFDVNKHLESQKKKNTSPPADVTLIYSFQPQEKATLPVTGETYMLSNGDTVYYGFGKMPVVKPDMTNFTIMPNVTVNNRIPGSNWPGTPLPGEMPNAAKPLFFELLVK